MKVWDCTSACYSKRFLETAGAKAEGEYVDMPFVPVEEAKYSPAVKAYVKSVGSGVIDGNGEEAWGAALFFRDAVNAVVKAGGVNALTRANFLTQAGEDPLVQRRRHARHQRHPGQEGDAVHVAVPGEGRQVRAGVPEEAGDVRLQPQERRHREADPADWLREEESIVAYDLSGKVALVTGASKNIGKGIALEVGASGAVTYLTARSVDDVPGQLASLHRTVAEIEARGGKAIAVACDHTDDAQVEAVFDRIGEEQGRLDLVVNVASPDFTEMVGVSFWDIPFHHITACLEIGPRSDYVTTALAAPIMIEQGSGVIVNISSHGAEGYLLSVPYGVGKAAIDKVTHDTAVRAEAARRRPWCRSGRGWCSPKACSPTPVLDRRRAARAPRARRQLRGDARSSTARPSSRSAADPDILERTGGSFWTATLAREYGFTEDDGHLPPEIAERDPRGHGRRHARLLARRRAHRRLSDPS